MKLEPVAWISKGHPTCFVGKDYAKEYLSNTDGFSPLYTEAQLKQAILDEREACAKICEDKYQELIARDSFAASACRGWITRCAESIRARE